MSVGHAHEFHSTTEHGIAHGKTSGHSTGLTAFGGICPHKTKQNHTLQEGFVELRRMAWQGAAAGEHNSPGEITDFAPQFAVDKIAQASEEQTLG